MVISLHEVKMTKKLTAQVDDLDAIGAELAKFIKAESGVDA